MDLKKEWAAWRKSSVAKELWGHIRANAAELSTVNIIMCSGLGSVKPSQDGNVHPLQIYLRYRAVVYIKEILDDLQPAENRPTGFDGIGSHQIGIDIAACAEEDFCNNFAQYLMDEFSITLWPKSFFKQSISEGAFIVGKSSNFSASEIEVEQGKKIQGVVGLLCDPIDE
ncbi:hypothetical protein T440DRAFT_516051 [Plenodomus tracheiphilus IPT5]|uniref:Uncharacterized protein n=1 Tax=Plenodomus tracheiphilus IPT5 TaxID=1408161 RepID=A0A6A7BBV2_9PLEO|nr:hypothetical protein T440DRAFT_516051 [Plenodomus tracheiphilus IPT5]